MKEQIINEFLSAFLKDWRKAVKNGIHIVPRDKNLDFIGQSGLTLNMVKENLRNIDEKDYYKGPEPDRDKPNDFIWVFKIEIYGIKDIYTKVKVFEVNGKKHAKCISFHK